MNKVLRFVIPLILSCLMIGMTLLFTRTMARASTSALDTSRGEIIVTTLEDELNNDQDCSLREAIQAANTNAAVDACVSGEVVTDTITFEVMGIIMLTNRLTVTASGPLVIDGGEVITTSGGNTTSVWWIEEDSQVILQSMTVKDGRSTVGIVSGAGIFNQLGKVTIINSKFLNNDAQYGTGGGISNAGSMEIIDSSFTSNVTGNPGGAIFNQGTMTITHSTFTGNSATYEGGGIFNTPYEQGGSYYGGKLTITSSEFFDNIGGYGGGIANYGNLRITDSTFAGNEAEKGAGVFHGYGELNIDSSTFAYNSALSGGGVYSTEILKVVNSTFAANNADFGGGIVAYNDLQIVNSTFYHNAATNNGGNIWYGGAPYRGNWRDNGYLSKPRYITVKAQSTLILTNTTISNGSALNGGGIFVMDGEALLVNTIVANNPSGGDCFGTFGLMFTDGGHNLDSDGTCELDPGNGSLPGIDPLLGPIQDNGGPTFTQALLPGSLAIDAGDNATCPSTDQRGVIRPQDGNRDGVATCDIGAYESETLVNTQYLPLIKKSP